MIHRREIPGVTQGTLYRVHAQRVGLDGYGQPLADEEGEMVCQTLGDALRALAALADARPLMFVKTLSITEAGDVSLPLTWNYTND